MECLYANHKNYYLSLLFFVLLGLTAGSSLYAEGTRELTPVFGNEARMQIWDGVGVRKFATYEASGVLDPADTLFSLNVTIGAPTEKLYFGFRQDNNDTYFRIRDPNGNIVYGPVLIPSAGAGYIPNYNEAVTGPSQVDGNGVNGYNAMELTNLIGGGYTLIPGDYKFEFNPRHPTNIRRQKRTFRYVDFTVGDGAGNSILGRVNSRNWDINMMGLGGNEHRYLASMYVYAPDGIVTLLDFNGMQPYGFNISCNGTGCFDTGDWYQDRRSVPGNNTYPSYRVFLNDPDSTLFPNGRFGDVSDSGRIVGCATGNYSFELFVDKPGDIEIVVELNGQAGFQENSRDVFIRANADSGRNLVPWDGLDGLGNPIPPGNVLDVIVNFLNGLTNLPLYDVERNTRGFIVQIHRPNPPSGQKYLEVYWDDTLINAGTALDAKRQIFTGNGCQTGPGNGCHRWTGRGNNGSTPPAETINTWWFAEYDTVTIQMPNPRIFVDADTATPGDVTDSLVNQRRNLFL